MNASTISAEKQRASANSSDRSIRGRSARNRNGHRPDRGDPRHGDGHIGAPRPSTERRGGEVDSQKSCRRDVAAQDPEHPVSHLPCRAPRSKAPPTSPPCSGRPEAAERGRDQRRWRPIPTRINPHRQRSPPTTGAHSCRSPHHPFPSVTNTHGRCRRHANTRTADRDPYKFAPAHRLHSAWIITGSGVQNGGRRRL